MRGLDADQAVVPESEIKQLRAQVRELQRMLGKKTMEAEILEHALEPARSKKLLLPSDSSKPGWWRMKPVADALGVARSNLAEQCKSDEPKPRRHPSRDDECLLAMIRTAVAPHRGLRLKAPREWLRQQSEGGESA